MALTYLLLGGNKYNRKYYLSKAKETIETKIGIIIKESMFYETEPWGFNDEKYFLNQVILIETGLSPHDLLNSILSIEHNLGRQRIGEDYSSRVIDIDILFYENLILNDPDLIIHHPLIQNRMFTLIPMNEINSTLIHPVLNQTIENLIKDCKDTSKVKVYLH